MTVPEDRPLVEVDHHTEDLPDLPQRDRTIPADRWVEAPSTLLALGDDIDAPVVIYKRRIGGWLLWRAGPPNKGDTRYMALAANDLGRQFTFRQLQGLLEEAGFRNIDAMPTYSYYSIVRGTKP